MKSKLTKMKVEIENGVKTRQNENRNKKMRQNPTKMKMEIENGVKTHQNENGN
jgi:type II secretory pathway component PulF